MPWHPALKSIIVKWKNGNYHCIGQPSINLFLDNLLAMMWLEKQRVSIIYPNIRWIPTHFFLWIIQFLWYVWGFMKLYFKTQFELQSVGSTNWMPYHFNDTSYLRKIVNICSNFKYRWISQTRPQLNKILYTCYGAINLKVLEHVFFRFKTPKGYWILWLMLKIL